MSEDGSHSGSFRDNPVIVTIGAIVALIGVLVPAAALYRNWSSSGNPTPTPVTRSEDVLPDFPPSPIPDSECEKGRTGVIKSTPDFQLFLRQLPTTDSVVLDNAVAGEEVKVLKEVVGKNGKKWSRVCYKGKKGFMYSKYLEIQ